MLSYYPKMPNDDPKMTSNIPHSTKKEKLYCMGTSNLFLLTLKMPLLLLLSSFDGVLNSLFTIFGHQQQTSETMYVHLYNLLHCQLSVAAEHLPSCSF